MAIRKFNAYEGISVGDDIITYDVIDNVGNVTANNLIVDNKSNLGAVGNITITGGTPGYILSTDGSGNLSWTNPLAAGVSGLNTEVQFNNAGSFGNSANFTFNRVTNTLSVTNILVTNANVTGNVDFSTASNVTLGNLAVANYFSGNGSLLTNITGANVTGTVANANYAAYAGNVTIGSQPNITSVGTLSSLSVTGNITANNMNVANDIHALNVYAGNLLAANYFQGDGSALSNVTSVSGSSNYSNFAGQVVDSTQSNITSLGTLASLSVTGNVTAGNANLGNLAEANYLKGNGSLITGLTLANSLSDVVITSANNGQILGYNGVNWVNVNNSQSVSAGAGVNFYFTTPVINVIGPNSDIQVDTLSSTPNTSTQLYASVTVNGTGVINGIVSTALNRTVFDAGNWDFSIWANITSVAGTNTINCGVHQVLPNAGTVTVTGTGTSRTATASSGTPFATVVPGSDVILSSYLQLPNGLYRITAKTSDTVVTINVPSTYTNDTSALASVWIPLFNVGSLTFTSTALTEYIFGTTQPQYSVTTNSAIGILVAATTSTSKTVNITLNGTNQSSHVLTPLHTLHDDLAGLQGGQSGEYFHLTTAEYTGTGNGIFVRQTSPQLTTPNIGAATGTSLSLTGNITSGNAHLGNLATANYFSGDGSLLSNLQISNASVANANYATYAGTVVNASQSNITSLGTLSNLTSNGTINFTNASNVALGNVANVHITGGQDGQILVTDGAGNLQWVDNSPSSVTYLANSITLTHGVYVTGNLYSIQVFGDYNDPDGVYVLTDGTGSAPAWWVDVDFVSVTNFNRVVMNINYTLASGHTIYVQLYNYTTSFSLSAATVTTTSGTNIVTVSSTANMSIGQIIIFGTSVGGLTAGTPYYILSIPSSGQLTVGTVYNAVSGTGTVTTLSTDSQTSTVDIQNWDVIGSYTGLGTYYAFALQVVSDTNYLNAGQARLRLDHANQGNASHQTSIDYIALELSSQGPQGPRGPTGATGNTGPGVASGGTTGQVLVKNSNANYDTAWTSTLSLTGNITVGNADLGNLVVANYFSGNGSLLTSLTGGNVTGTVANANFAAYGNYASYAGQIVDASQSNITSLGTLTSLTISGNVSSGNANLGNLVTANYFSGNGSLLTSITGGNVTGQVGNALIAGTVYTNAQPNITSLGTLSSLNVTGNITSGANLIGKLFSSTNTTLAVPGPGNVSGERVRLYDFGNSSVTNFAIGVEDHYIWSAVDATNSGFKWYAGNAIAATLEGNGQFTTVGNITATNANLGNLVVANFFGGDGGYLSNLQIANASVANANYAAYAGDIVNGSQSNITSVGTLVSLNITGNVSSGNAYLGNLVTAGFFSGDGYLLSNITAANINGTVANANYSLYGNYASYAGEVVNGTQSNITSVGTLTGLAVTGNISSGNASLGNLATANYFSGDGSLLSNINVANIGTVANANYAAYAGDVINATQSNITSLGTLTSLTVTGNITSGNASLGNLATANYFTGNGSLLTNITGGNVSGQVGNALIAGTVYTNAQPNITSLGTLSSLSVTGNITAGNANLGNLVIANYFSGDGSLLSNINVANIGTVANANYAAYAGNVINASQSNITSVGTLSGLSVSGNATITGNLTVSGTTIYANVTTLNVKDPIIEMGGNPNGDPLTTDDGKDRGTLLHYYHTSATDAFMGWDNGNLEFALGSNVSVINEVVTFNTYGNLRASYYFGNASELTGTIANSNYAAYAGNVINASQSNITSLGTLTSLTVTGNVTAGNASLGNLVSASYFSGDGGLLSNINVANIGTVANANYAAYAGNVVNATQSNITSLGTLTSLSITGNVTAGNASLGNLVSASYFSGDGSLLTSITGGNVTGTVANANYAAYAGNVINATQSNITSVGRLVSLTVGNSTANTSFGNGTINASGNITSLNANLGNLVIANFFSGDGGYLSNIQDSLIANYANYAGTVVNSDQSNITSVGRLSSLRVGNATANTLFGNGTITAPGNITAGNANLGNLVIANFFSGDGGYLSNLQISSATVANANYANYAGQVLDATQSNITSVGTLNGLTVSGNLTTGNASLGNLATANYITGTLTTGAQSNITSVGSLTGLIVSNASGVVNFNTTANVSLGAVGNLHISGGTNGYVLKTDGAGNLSWIDPTTAGAAGSNTQVQYNNNSALAGSANFTFNNTSNTLTVDKIIANGAGITYITGGNVSGQVGNALVAGTVYTGAQPNITSLGTLVDINLTGAGNANLGNLATANYFSGNGSLLTHITGGNVSGQVGNALVAGTVYTGAQPNITSVGTVSGLTIQSTGSISGANSMTANYFTGTLTTAAQPNITSLGTLTSVIVSGTSNLGPIGNVTITGGSSGYVLTTNGSGGLSWQAGSGSSGSSLVKATKDNFVGDGSNNTFTLTTTPSGVSAVQASIDGLVQQTGAYSLSGTDIVFSSPPASGSSIEVTTYGVLASSGSNTQVYYNDAGSLGNSAAFTFTNTTNTLTVTNFTSSGNINLTSASNVALGSNANVHITGGSSGQYLQTDGSGGLSWVSPSAGSSIINGTSNVNIASSGGNVTVGVAGNAGIVTVTGTGVNVAGTLNTGSGVITTTGNVTAGNANLGNLATANYFSGNGSLLTSVTGGNITGQVGNALIAGTVYTNAQPNITSLGTLSSLSVTGNISSGNANLGNLAVASYFSGDGSLLSNLNPANIGQVANANYAAYAGNVVNASQSNITSLGTLTSLTVTGNISSGNANLGNLAVANFFSGDASLLSAIAGANVNGIVANANYAAYAGNVINAAQSNITSLGTLASLSVTGNVTAGNANLGNLVVANYFTGILTTATQSNITTVGTLASLSVTGNITAGNANLGNLVVANYFSGDGGYLSNLQISSATVANANYANFAGNVINPAQPNITSLGTLTSLTASGNITAGNANLGNLVTANYFSGSANLLTGVIANANYAAYAGNVVTASQPNITSLGTLTSLSTGDTTVTGNLTVTGTTIYANVTTLNVKDPIIEMGGNPNGTPLSTNDGKDRGTLLHYYVTGNSTAVDAFMGWDNSNAEFAFGSNVTNSSEVMTFNNFGNIRASYFLGNGSQLTGVIANANYAAYAGDVVNASQSNITSLGTLTSLTVTGNVTSGNANLGNLVTANYFTGNGSLLTSLTGGNVTGQVGNALIAGTVYTNAQPNITSVGTLTSLNVTGNISSGNANLGNLAVANYFSGDGGYLSNLQISSATVANANYANFSGNVINAAQSNITSLGTLTGLTSGGTINFTTASNVSLGAVGNLHVTGGSNHNVLQTNGSGALSWGALTATVDTFTGNGVQTDFTLSVTPTSKNLTMVNYNGAILLKADYSLTGAVISISSAPFNGSALEVTTFSIG